MPSELESLAAQIRQVAAEANRVVAALVSHGQEVRALISQTPTTQVSSSRAAKEALFEARQALEQASDQMHQFTMTAGRFADGLVSGHGGANTVASTLHVVSSDGLPDGFSMVSLEAIDSEDREITEADFTKGSSPEDLTWALEAFQDVIAPGISGGQTLDDFRQMDAQQGLTGTRSYGETYSSLLGTSPRVIKLVPTGDGRFTVKNGYHRIWLARRIGLTHLPARTS